MADPIIIIPINEHTSAEELISKEWLVTNGLGGYASGSLLGVNTRRYHGVFIPNLPSPRGRTMMLPYLEESVLWGDDQHIELGGNEFSGTPLKVPGLSMIKDFRLDWQTPSWSYQINSCRIEKKIFMPYGFNTAYVTYRLAEGSSVKLRLRPYCACRKTDSELGYPYAWPFTVSSHADRYEVSAFDGAPILRLTLKPFRNASFVGKTHLLENVYYRKEASRGLDDIDSIFSPGYFLVDLKEGENVSFIVSTESWESMEGEPFQLYQTELQRRKNLVEAAPRVKNHLVTAQLTLAADQFIILPQKRNEKNAIDETSSKQSKTVIAGYHWFTDWGRDTMISLEGLTLYTGRADQAKAILQTFGHYVRNGLLPNHFPEGWADAVYNTVDATFWYFHAIDRYLEMTHDTKVLELLYPTLQHIIDAHVKGTDFGIHMDPQDGLIVAAAEGFQLTWMDAKVDEWVVTPRRGKPVEIQALWYNALKLMDSWSQMLNQPVDKYNALCEQAGESFNKRFWYSSGGYLYDVIDSDKGDDNTFRPNQIFALSLRHEVLRKELWKPVVDIVEKRLFTPYGLRTLDPSNKNYHGKYEGNRWNRDAAYHQGLVWPWLLGPFLNGWKKVYADPSKAREFLASIEIHLKEEGIGSISEIFDGDSPYQPRGCIAQAWSVAEVLRCFMDLNSI